MKKLNKIMAMALASIMLMSQIAVGAQTDYSDTAPATKPASAWASAHAVYEKNNGNMALVKSSDNTERTYTLDKEAGIGKQWHIFSGERFISAAGKDGASGRNVDKFEKGKTYVYQVGVKNLNPEVDAYYGIAYLKKESYSTDDGVASNYYGIDGMKVTATDEYQLFQDTITIGADWDDTKTFTQSMHQGLSYKSPLNASIRVNVGAAYRYFAEEVPYDLVITPKANSNTMDIMGKLEVDAEVVNQIGIKGTLTQDVTWKVLNRARTEEIDQGNIKATVTDNTVTLTCGDNAVEGDYTVVAISDTYGFRKGYDFKVETDLAQRYKEYVPGEKPASAWASAHAVYEKNNGNMTLVKSSDNTERTYTLDKEAGIGKQWHLFSGERFISAAGKDGASGRNVDKFEKGKTYVYQVGVKNLNPEVDAYYGIAYLKKDSYNFDDGVASNYYGIDGMKVTATDEYQLFQDTITIGADWDDTKTFTQSMHQGLSYKSPLNASIRVNVGAAYRYFAEEVVYDLAVTAPETALNSEHPIEMSAEVVNQLGIPGTLKQNINWYALTADRKAYESKVHVTPNAGKTVTVSVDPDTPFGKYVIVAQSADYPELVKNIEIEVKKLPVKDYVSGATPDNLITNPGESTFAENSNSTAVTIANETGSSKLTANEEITNTAEGLKVTSVLFEAGKTYAVKAKVKKAAGDGDVYFNAYIDNNGTPCMTKEYGQDGLLLTNEWQEFKGSIEIPDNMSRGASGNSLVLGLNKGTPAAAAVDVELSVYVAEEEAYDIVVNPAGATIGANESAEVNVKVVNQLGIEGGLSQAVKWTLLDAEKTDETDEMDVVVSQDGKKATVTSDVFTVPATYYIAAESTTYDKFIKTSAITVNKLAAKECAIDCIKTKDEANLTAYLADYIKAMEIDITISNLDYAQMAKLIIAERSNYTSADNESFIAFVKKTMVIAGYKNSADLYDSEGKFKYETELGLKDIDTAGITLYDNFINATSAEGRKAVQSAITGAYGTFDEFYAKLKEEMILKAISHSSKSGTGVLESILTDANAAAAGINISEYSTLSNKADATQYILAKTFTKAELETVIANIDTTIANGKANEKPSYSGSYYPSTGGGSSVAPSIPFTPQSGKEEDKKEEETVSDTIFTDVPETHWAYSDIYYLKKINVLSGMGENTFAPEGLLTREQIVKILCTALNIEATNAGTAFIDVQNDAWYESYVNAAFAKGIVNGIDENNFGVGKVVTREDICVMITRALGVELTDGFSTEFSDADTIASYAKDSVAYLSSIGVIKGMGDGTFCPKKPCTRAQAAKIICTILNLEEVL